MLWGSFSPCNSTGVEDGREITHLTEVLKLLPAALAIAWLGSLITLGKLERIRTLALTEELGSVGNSRGWTHQILLVRLIHGRRRWQRSSCH